MTCPGAERPPGAAGSADADEWAERPRAEQPAAEERSQAPQRPGRPRDGLGWAALINHILQQTVPAAIQFGVHVMSLRQVTACLHDYMGGPGDACHLAAGP